MTLLAAVVLACAGWFEPAPSTHPLPVVSHDVQALRSLAPLPERVEEVSWVYAPIGTPGLLGPTDYKLSAWVTGEVTLAETEALYGSDGELGLWRVDTQGVLPPVGSFQVDKDGNVSIRGTAYAQDGPMLTRVIVGSEGIWIEGMTR
ncbi:MAG: hypothetical protein VX899_26675 [Myxococcota bacterium]|nr:hypothetical protein [Myxococcota bacterium]